MSVFNTKVVRPDENSIDIKSGGFINVETGGIIKANGTQASHIADAAAAAGAAPNKAEFDAVVTKLNAVLAALEGAGILKTS